MLLLSAVPLKVVFKEVSLLFFEKPHRNRLDFSLVFFFKSLQNFTSSLLLVGEFLALVFV